MKIIILFLFSFFYFGIVCAQSKFVRDSVDRKYYEEAILFSTKQTQVYSSLLKEKKCVRLNYTFSIFDIEIDQKLKNSLESLVRSNQGKEFLIFVNSCYSKKNSNSNYLNTGLHAARIKRFLVEHLGMDEKLIHVFAMEDLNCKEKNITFIDILLTMP